MAEVRFDGLAATTLQSLYDLIDTTVFGSAVTPTTAALAAE